MRVQEVTLYFVCGQSGKSFYLRTVAVLQVMAQIGCFVAADFAMIRICDQLFSRIGSDNVTDNLESSFTVEVGFCHVTHCVCVTVTQKKH